MVRYMMSGESPIIKPLAGWVLAEDISVKITISVTKPTPTDIMGV